MSVTSYLREARGEMRHVSWPTRNQTISYTVIVIALSLGTAALLGFLDYTFKQALEIFIK